MSDITLTYFNGRGLAETSRMILAIAEQEYTDFRYPLEVLCWKTYNFVRDEFDKDKKDGKLSKSLNKLPFLTVDNNVICQSKSIERYLAKRFNMMGVNEIEDAQIDSICEWIRDFKQDYQKIRQLPETDNERIDGMETWFTQDLPNKLEQLELLISSINMSDNNITLADISIYCFICEFFDNKSGAINATNNTPNIKKLIDKVSNLQTVKDWLEKRPNTPF